MIDGIVWPIVLTGARALGIDLPQPAETAFETYYNTLEQKGRSVNLTSIKGATEVTSLHFLDSIALLKAASFSNTRVIDIGSGAGFPGIPLKIAEPSISLTALDSANKRIAFLSELCSELGIEARLIHARAEESARDPNMRESCDIALSRAVARLNVLCELCLPFVCVGGLFIAMKDANCADEIREAKNAIKTLGAQHLDDFDYLIPGTEITHRAVLIKKTSKTPDNYPRRFARIKNSPL